MAIDWKEWTGPAALLGVAGGLLWLGALAERIDNVESVLEGVSENASCEHLVNRLSNAIERSDVRAQQDFERIAERWGCTWSNMSHTITNTLEEPEQKQ